ncbi:hypothetical protein [Rhodococcus sp. 077-4]|uniref:hypothetical protein n=1 Tax=Rhodococcus sp. 077-4 TaxID=2789271 RepID=UPI0039F5A826
MTLRRNWLLAATALALTVSTSGCAAVVLGNASPASQNRYGFEMSEVDQYLSESAAFVRSLDPCGFLTEDDLAALGTLVQLRPDGELSQCTAELATGRSSAPDSVTIDLDSYQPLAEDSDVEQVTIGGVQVYVNDSSGDLCRITFPLREKFDGAIEGPMESFHTESGRSYAMIDVYRADGDACTAAKSVAETALRLLDDPPLRAGSKYDLPLAAKDPCAVLGRLPETWTVDRWSPAADPYRCNFTVSSAAFEDNFAMLDVALTYVDGDVDSTDRETVRQGGYSVETRDLDSSCLADIVVGNPVLGMPEKDDSAARYARTVPTVSAMMDDCDSAAALAVAAADVLTG